MHSLSPFNLSPLSLRTRLGQRFSALGRRFSSQQTLGQRFASLQTDPTFDVLVVGGGIMGVWAAIHARKRGATVALADQFAPTHEHGSSHGDGRIYRFAYTEDLYVDMMEHSLPLWLELQAHAGEPLLQKTGGLNMASINGGRLNDQASLYERRGIPYERLSARASNERFPQIRLSPGDEALYQADFGVLFASKCVAAAWDYATALGVTTMTPFRASTLKAHGSNVHAVDGVDGEAILARSVVFAPGAWISGLAADLLQLRIPTHVSAETVCYYAPKDGAPDHSYRSMPCFIPEYSNGLGNFGYYGLPMIDIPGIKASAHYAGPVIHPDRRPRSAGGMGSCAGAVDAAEDAAAAAKVAAVIESTNRLIADKFPHVESEPFQTQSCLYTTTPDHDYILSDVPTIERVVVAGGGSGHAFKMAPAIGEASAALALGEPPPFSLEQFDVRRLLALDSSAAADHEVNAARK